MEITVRCGCTRTMRPDTFAGPGSYRCGCGARVALSGLPDNDARRCPIRVDKRTCRGAKLPDAMACRPCTILIAKLALANPAVACQLGTDQGAVEFSLARQAETERLLAMDLTRVDRRPDAPKCGVVYYAELRPGIVKIGTTLNLVARMNGLHIPPASVIAAEPGTYDVEKTRHRQFADQRIGQREDFRVDEVLRAHVEAVAAEHGNPYELAARLADQTSGLASRASQS